MCIVFATVVGFADVLISQDWSTIKTRLEPLIVQYALEERKRLVISRKAAIDTTYKRYKSHFLPPKPLHVPICTLPSLSVLGLYEPIKSLLSLPSGTKKQAKSGVADFVDTWPHLTVQELASIYSPLHVSQNAMDVPLLTNLNIHLVAPILCIPCTRAHNTNPTFFWWGSCGATQG